MDQEMRRKFMSDFYRKSRDKINELADQLKVEGKNHDEREAILKELSRISRFHQMTSAFPNSVTEHELTDLVLKAYYNEKKPWETFFDFEKEKSAVFNKILK